MSDIDLPYTVNSILGNVRVNFDAEYSTNRFNLQKSLELCNTYYKWSETLQTSAVDANARFKDVVYLLENFNNFSVNFVIGNKKYDCSEKSSTLENTLRAFETNYRHLFRENIKIGAERIINGTKSIELCKQYSLTAYLLQNEHTSKLLEKSRQYNVKTAMYTIARIAESKEEALKELLKIIGNGYFNRRGVADSEIKKKSYFFCIFGSESDILNQANRWSNRGVDKLVFNLVFKDLKDYEDQLCKLKSITKTK